MKEKKKKKTRKRQEKTRRRQEEDKKKEREEVKETPGYANTNTKKPARLLRCVLRGKIAMSLL